jgi:hypothetical protein
LRWPALSCAWPTIWGIPPNFEPIDLIYLVLGRSLDSQDLQVRLLQ